MFLVQQRAAVCIGAKASLLVLAVTVVVWTLGPRGQQSSSAAAPPQGDFLRGITQLFETRTGGLCNASVVPPAAVRPRAFELPAEWRGACEALRRSELEWDWPGRNWCWVWVKQEACYTERTWWQAQERAAGSGNAPNPAIAMFEALQSRELCDDPALGAALQADIAAAEREAAYAWFEQAVSVYVVNLPTAMDRWTHISSRLRDLGILATRVSGIDFSAPGALQRAQTDGLVPASWDLAEAEQNMRRLLAGSTPEATARYLREFGLGTAGCTAAHLRAMRMAGQLERWKKRPLALILEDDVWLEDDFVVRLHRLLQHEAPCDWDVISLRSQCPFGECISPHLTRVQPDGNEPAVSCRKGVNFGFFAMLYRADRLQALTDRLGHVVWDTTKIGCLANDVALAAISDEVAYYAVPTSQMPSFLRHGFKKGDSVRSQLNVAAASKLDVVLRMKQEEVTA